MNDTPRSRVGRWIALVMLVALAAGLAAWFASQQPLARNGAASVEPRPAEAQDQAGAIEDDDQVVEQALGQIPGYVDSTAIKSRWVDEVDGVEVLGLNPSEREIFVRAANTRRCTCGCGYTLAACRRFDTTCPVSLGLVEALRDSVASGAIASTQGLRERPHP